ncbi:hypothetical protein CYMTET_32506 [Cymbomonas tetramitiformis]|uniref:3'-5' exonuclease domain-containing protein n=1 Tax=Cymbomonas tetramitiformis TaxID=36881 RepID=A0AAE0FEQ8_9CHLO|nr:hypothetical protein CYMTET_32506 [Cymbomonas tetramitiformis]
MEARQVAPDIGTYVAVLEVCAAAGDFACGETMFRYLVHSKLPLNGEVYIALLKLCANAGPSKDPGGMLARMRGWEGFAVRPEWLFGELQRLLAECVRSDSWHRTRQALDDKKRYLVKLLLRESLLDTSAHTPGSAAAGGEAAMHDGLAKLLRTVRAGQSSQLTLHAFQNLLHIYRRQKRGSECVQILTAVMCLADGGKWAPLEQCATASSSSLSPELANPEEGLPRATCPHLLPTTTFLNSVIESMCCAGELHWAMRAYHTMLLRGLPPTDTTFHLLIDWHLLARKAAAATALYAAMRSKGFEGDLGLYVRRLVTLGEPHAAFTLIDEALGRKPAVAREACLGALQVLATSGMGDAAPGGGGHQQPGQPLDAPRGMSPVQAAAELCSKLQRGAAADPAATAEVLALLLQMAVNMTPMQLMATGVTGNAASATPVDVGADAAARPAQSASAGPVMSSAEEVIDVTVAPAKVADDAGSAPPPSARAGEGREPLMRMAMESLRMLEAAGLVHAAAAWVPVLEEGFAKEGRGREEVGAVRARCCRCIAARTRWLRAMLEFLPQLKRLSLKPEEGAESDPGHGGRGPLLEQLLAGAGGGGAAAEEEENMLPLMIVQWVMTRISTLRSGDAKVQLEREVRELLHTAQRPSARLVAQCAMALDTLGPAKPAKIFDMLAGELSPQAQEALPRELERLWQSPGVCSLELLGHLAAREASSEAIAGDSPSEGKQAASLSREPEKALHCMARVQWEGAVRVLSYVRRWDVRHLVDMPALMEALAEWQAMHPQDKHSTVKVLANFPVALQQACMAALSSLHPPLAAEITENLRLQKGGARPQEMAAGESSKRPGSSGAAVKGEGALEAGLGAGDEENFLELGVAAEGIHWVDDAAGVERLRTALEAAASHGAAQNAATPAGEGLGQSWLGIDVEWHWQRRHAALLQLGLCDEVFLVDLLAVGCSNELQDALLAAFRSETLLKLAYGIRNDLTVLHRSFPSAPCYTTMCNMLDLQTCDHAARQPKGAGLSALVCAYLSHPLDKRHQRSDWEARPLSQPQMQYAAQDAHCLLRIYHVMQQCREAGVSTTVSESTTISVLQEV